MANVPAYDTSRISFGPGILYIGPVGATPTIDIGAVKGDFSMEIKRTPLEVKAGSPQSLIQQYVVEEAISFKGTAIEWNLDRLADIMGAGVTSINGAVTAIGFGGDMAVSEKAVRFVHNTPDGSTIDIQLFRAQGAGDMSISMKETDVHEFPFEFKALESSTNFTGATAVKQKRFKIIRTKA